MSALPFHIWPNNSPICGSSYWTSATTGDIILDDGGHTNENQILTTYNTINHIKDGGLLVVEDTYSSYSKKFFNPSKYSFINYSKFLIDDLNGRVSDKYKTKLNGVHKKRSLKSSIYSIKFFSNFVAFFIDRDKCIEYKEEINRDLEDKKSEIIKDDFVNPRWNSDIYNKGLINKTLLFLSKKFKFLKINMIKNLIHKIKLFFIKKTINKKLKNYFK